MSRQLSPQSQALQDRICSVLADAWPEMLTSTQIAERVGGKRTLWEVCRKGETFSSWDGRAITRTCRAEHDDRRFPATHHDGPVPQDSWEVPWDAMAMNPHLNRLARNGLLQKIKVQALRGVLWRWAGDSDDEVLVELERLWQASS